MAGQSKQGDNRRPSAKKGERHSGKKPERTSRTSGTRHTEKGSKRPAKRREDHRSENKPERTSRTSETRRTEKRSERPVRRQIKQPEEIAENAPTQRKNKTNSQKSALSIIGGITKNVVKAGIRVLGDVGEYIAENQADYERAEARKRQRIRAISQNDNNVQSVRVVRPENTIIILEREPKKVMKSPMKPKVPQPAVIDVLGGTYDKHPKKVNKTATGKILGGKYLR